MSVNAIQHKWKHEIPLALLRRGADTTRAVLLNNSARAQWLLAGRIDRANSHWVRAPLLDGGEDEDTDTEPTTVPDDDNDDVASFTSQQTTAIHTSNL